MDPFQPPPPSSSSSSSSLLRDISNFKTPRRPSQCKPATSRFNFESPNPQFFTASKQTPRTASSCRRTPARSAATARRLRAFEIEQSRSSRKAQLQKQRSLKTLSKSLTAWLNFLFENPGSCGCDSFSGHGGGMGKGKRETGPGQGVGPETMWRSPKRQRDLWWKIPEESENGGGRLVGFLSSEFVKLRDSLKDVCSFDDLAERMMVYLSLDCCREIFNVMTQVTKNIDDGRLKMKAHCPIVTDFGMKDKAMRTLFSYNPVWLRIGLYILLGGDSLLTNGEIDSDKDIAFLKMVVDKQFLSHAELGKIYAYNKKVEGLYRPGYYECLGNIILKRFLLLIIILDRAKSQSSLPIKYGIDGLDGGSPLLFVGSSIKSSSQMVNDFLSDVMHGEGNLIAHLVILGFKLSHHQNPLVEYDFKLVDMLEDLQDGVRLCRAVQLLKQDSSILMKLMVPSDTNKRNLANCSIALQYLKQYGVPLCDDDEMSIVADDIASGDKELTLSLVWNMFVHLQLPLLLDGKILVAEVDHISGATADKSLSTSFTSMDMLLHWIQAICDNYELKIESLYSLTDGKAIWCLLDYYFRKELSCSCAAKGAKGEESIVSAGDYPDAVHNFVLLQRLAALLGDFPEVLETGDIIEHHGVCNGRSIVLLLAFLASQLIMKKNMDCLNFHKLLGCTCQTTARRLSSLERLSSSSKEALNLEDSDHKRNEDAARKFKEIQAWWQKMADRNFKSISKPNSCSFDGFSSSNCRNNIQKELAARVIQSHYRGFCERRKFSKMRTAVSVLQNAIQVWLIVRQKTMERSSLQNNAARVIQSHYRGFCERCKFLKMRSAASVLQNAIQVWLIVRQKTMERSSLQNKAARVIQFHYRGFCERCKFSKMRSAVSVLQNAIRVWLIVRQKTMERSSLQNNAAQVIQSHYRGSCERHKFLKMRSAVSVLQNAIQVWLLVRQKTLERSSHRNNAALKIQLAWKNFVSRKSLKVQHFAAINIQRHLRGWLMRRTYQVQKKAAIKIQTSFWYFKSRQLFQARVAARSAILIQSYVRRWMIQRKFSAVRYHVVRIQSHVRGWLRRREFLLQREAAITIQSSIRQIMLSTLFQSQRHAAIKIQHFARKQISKNRLLGAYATPKKSSCSAKAEEMPIVLPFVLKLQRWWRAILLLRLQTKSAVIIQSFARMWFARRQAARERQRVVLIQSCWKGYVARKEAGGRIVDLRLRMQKSAANVDDSMRLINRLTAALSELLNLRSVSSILHICATLDTATWHSQKCCEKLVEVGAIDKLLKLICSMTRSIPDQEVLKHALSTLRNLARYPHLVEVLIESHGSIETIFREMLRNKEEGYFIACELLRKICLNRRSVEAVQKLPSLVKRLHSFVEELRRKADIEKRNTRSLAARENTERRLKEASRLLKLMSM